MLLPFLNPDIIEAGLDEAGRGCLCGPVACAAVILPPDFQNEMLNDSKKLTARRREQLRGIIEKEAVAWAVVMVPPQEIDEINILNASIEGMHRAVARLSVTPQHLVVDGNRFKPYPGIPHTTVVKGDGKYMSVAAASILAKTHRDELMRRLADDYPGYDWHNNMGYPTKKHYEGLATLGPTPHHRLTFRLTRP